MIVIPALDLRSGRVVRLEQGDYDRETRYEADPVARAQTYAEAGAHVLHVVDLDGARDGGDGQLPVIARLADALAVPVQAGGGVRSERDFTARLEAGVRRVVVGSLCVREPATVEAWIRRHGPERVVAGLDVKRDDRGRWVPQAAGWTESGDVDLFSLLDRLTGAGLVHVLCTDIARDGMLSGAGTELYRELAGRYPGLSIQASGGIGDVDDLVEVAGTGVAGCIVGKALLEGRVPVEAIGRVFP
ncbi:MAG: HisA/HisF-related TIM barrel protein [Wenzhouxiangellaceae bacterium]|nr:HisA/HisF-related TIM barrel protein [Wenzhouxiangellaceae bacterium]